MNESPVTDYPGDQPSQDIAKDRQCLRCKVTFPSKWCGERICSRCKSSSAWRNNSPFRSGPSNNRR